MKSLVSGLLLGLLLAFGAWEVWQGVQGLRERQQGGSAAYHYLFDPLPNVKGPKGEEVRRVDIIDAALADYLQRQQAQAGK